MYIQGTRSIAAADPHTHGTARPVVGQRSRLGLTLLDQSAQQLRRKGIARQHKDIMTAARRFNQRCIKFLTGQYHFIIGTTASVLGSIPGGGRFQRAFDQDVYC